MKGINSTNINLDFLKTRAQKLLGKEIVLFKLHASGACNDAYYIETTDGGKYIVKSERTTKEFQPQNTLQIEAKVAQQISNLNLFIPTPKVCFVSEDPCMYGYHYIDGDLMIDTWPNLSEKERIRICHNLGNFHAEIGKKYTKDMAPTSGFESSQSPYLHPEVEKDYHRILAATDTPSELKNLAKLAKVLFDQTLNMGVFQFIHNDSHHENILIKHKKISGIIDFGEAMYGEVAKEFSRYIRDYPHYFEYIVASYEKASKNKLSRKRLVTNAFLSGLIDIIDDYHKNGKARTKAIEAVLTYQEMIVQF